MSRERMKGERHVEIGGVTWRYRLGRGNAVIVLPTGKKLVVCYADLTGRSPDTIERGQYKGTSDGMVTPEHVRRYIRRYYDEMITTPIENIVHTRAYVLDYLKFSQSLGRPRNLVEIHKARLGRQTKTIQGSAHRLWVWVRPMWTVYVGNAKGICFEVPERTTREKALAAWEHYKRAMGST